jgi:hypothetical protein
MSDAVTQANVLNVVIAHGNRQFERVIQWWKAQGVPLPLLAHGGEYADFLDLKYEPKIFVSDPRLRTREHERESQSITGIFQEVSKWLQGAAFTHIWLAEYDHIPLVSDISQRHVRLCQQEHADVLAYHLQRIDGTNHPHVLRDLSRRNNIFELLSRRSDSSVVLSALGTGSFWRREPFDAVASIEQTFPMYCELYVPTLAHHLGFRLRSFGEQNRWISAQGDRTWAINEAKANGAWSLHPVKQLASASL